MKEYTTQLTTLLGKTVGASLLTMSLLTTAAIASEGTETLLINKLTNVFLKLPEGNPTKAKITLRLADLHAERGRLEAKRELEKGCIECSNGEGDRGKALEYYQYVLPSLKGAQRQNVLVQIGHLYEVLGNNDKAISFYNDVIKGADSKGKAEAQFSLAEIYFKQRQYSKAQGFYQSALANKLFKRRGLASFRLAWCHYNTGQISKAVTGLEKILTTPRLLTRGGETLTNVDEDFKSEVAKDYTVFMAHDSQISFSAIQKVFELSPSKTRIENISFLAKELERLGQLAQAVEAWELVIKKTSDPQVRMEGLVYLAGLQIKNAEKAKVLTYLKRAFQNWHSLGKCKDAKQCELLKKRVRRLVFDWNRSEKEKPSTELIEAYKSYFSVAKKDGEALELAAQAATQAEQYEWAYTWNLTAQKHLTEKESQERLLIRQIEIAELAKNKTWLLSAQKSYLEKSPTQLKASEIRYQMAQNFYDQKQYQKSAEAFKALGQDQKVARKLRLQAAEMALDALVLVKNDQLIEAWARSFAESLPSQRQRFMQIAGQSVLSQTAQLSGRRAMASEEAWQTLNRFDIKSATNDKKKTYFKNRIILARKLKKFSAMDESLRAYLALKSLDNKERLFGLENKVWLSELQLNFDEAFKSFKKINSSDWLELARMADLAEKPSAQYYYNYLKQSEDADLAFSICTKLVKDAGKIGSRESACVPHLQKQKSIFASLLLEIYSGKQTSRQLDRTFKKYRLEKTPAAQVITRGLLIEKGDKAIKNLNRHKMDGRSHRVAQSIKRRMSLINGFEGIIRQASSTQDWLTQTLFLTELNKQYMRFYNDLLSLPMPKDLNEAEQQEYLGLLSQQAAPYKEKADQIQFKLKELWANEAAITQTFANFHKASAELQAVLGPQIEKLRTVADEKHKLSLALVYRKEHKRSLPSFALLEAARQRVKQSPLDKKALRNLIRLETARGYEPMIIYLNSRLKMVNNGFETTERSL